MKKSFTHLLICTAATAALVATSLGHAETNAVAQTGEFKKIDVRLAEEAFINLSMGSPRQKQSAIEQVKAAPQRYAPHVFYAMSEALFQEGKKDEGAFWFYAGQLRARFDANRCLDTTAGSAVNALNQRYGMAVNQYTFSNVAKLEALIPQVVEWDRKTPNEYDHRWINLHGMNAILTDIGSGTKSEPQSAPAAQWPEIAEKTRADYLSGFQEALKRLKS
jgi:hypothetical protein